MDTSSLKDAAAKAFLAGSYLKAADLNAELAMVEPGEPRHVVKMGYQDLGTTQC